MHALISQIPPTLYAFILLICAVYLIRELIVNRHNPKLTKGMTIGAILLITSVMGIAAIKINLFPASAEYGINIAIVSMAALGIVTFISSNTLHRKKTGIKMDPALKKLIIGALIFSFLCILFFVISYNLVNR